MPKSRNRVGKGGKNSHKKKVHNRNVKLKDEKNKVKKFQKEMFEKMMLEYDKQVGTEEGLPLPGSEADHIEGVDGPEI